MQTMIWEVLKITLAGAFARGQVGYQHDAAGGADSSSRRAYEDQCHHEGPAGRDLPAFFEAQPTQGAQLGDQAASGEQPECDRVWPEQRATLRGPSVIAQAGESRQCYEEEEPVTRRPWLSCHGALGGNPGPFAAAARASLRLGPFSRSAEHGDGPADYRKAEARVDDPGDEARLRLLLVNTHLLPFDHVPFGFSTTHNLCPSIEWFSQHPAVVG